MALMTGYGNSGDSHDFYAWDTAGKVWDRTQLSWVVWSDADYTNYRVAAAETGTTGRFRAVLPTDAVAYAMRFRGTTLAGSYLVWQGDVQADALTTAQAANIAAIDDVKAKTDLIGAISTYSKPAVQPTGVVNITCGNTFNENFDAGTDLSAYSEIWASIKRERADPDSDSIVQWSKTGGLVVLNSRAPLTGEDGTTTIGGTNSDLLGLTLTPKATLALLNSPTAMMDAVAVTTSGNRITLFEKEFTFSTTITKAV